MAWKKLYIAICELQIAEKSKIARKQSKNCKTYN